MAKFWARMPVCHCASSVGKSASAASPFIDLSAHDLGDWRNARNRGRVMAEMDIESADCDFFARLRECENAVEFTDKLGKREFGSRSNRRSIHLTIEGRFR